VIGEAAHLNPPEKVLRFKKLLACMRTDIYVIMCKVVPQVRNVYVVCYQQEPLNVFLEKNVLFFTDRFMLLLHVLV
jgi:hypothetical protein